MQEQPSLLQARYSSCWRSNSRWLRSLPFPPFQGEEEQQHPKPAQEAQRAPWGSLSSFLLRNQRHSCLSVPVVLISNWKLKEQMELCFVLRSLMCWECVFACVGSLSSWFRRQWERRSIWRYVKGMSVREIENSTCDYVSLGMYYSMNPWSDLVRARELNAPCLSCIIIIIEEENGSPFIKTHARSYSSLEVSLLCSVLPSISKENKVSLIHVTMKRLFSTHSFVDHSKPFRCIIEIVITLAGT